jgi:hypothetical protein
MRMRTISKLLSVPISFAVLFAVVASRSATAGSKGHPTTCPEASASKVTPIEGALYWTIGEHTFRRSRDNHETCVPTLPLAASNVSGQSKTFTGIDVDSATGERTLGLWLSDLDGTNKRLLVSHGDATAVSDPTFSSDGRSIYFIAQHPGHFELHRFDTTTSKLDTLIENPMPIAQPVNHQMLDGASAVAVRVGPCSGVGPTDMLVRDGHTQVSVHAVAPQLDGLWLTPIGWQEDDQLVVLSRESGCDGPGTLWIIRSLTTRPELELVASEVSDAVVQQAPRVTPPPKIVLDQNFTATS